MARPNQPNVHEEDSSEESPLVSTEQPTLFEVAPDESDGTHSSDSVSFLDRVLAFEGEPSTTYLASLLIGSMLMLAAAALDLFPWVASAFAVLGLVATMFRGGVWITLLCGLAAVSVVVIGSWPREPTLADVNPVGSAVGPQATQIDQAPEGSLGFHLGELADLWNALEEPPTISRGFSRSLERGPLDGFVLRFDDGASLAGAYDPADDAVYAISASTRLDHEVAKTMYLHLCFVLHPYSQECIDAYWEQGLDRKEPIDYLGSEHSAEWRMGDRTWQLAIVGNVQEIKVLGDHPG